MATQTFIVTEEAAGQRLDRFLSVHLPDISRASLKKAIEQGRCTVDALSIRSAATKVRLGQVITLDEPHIVSSVQAEQGDLDILWHDEHLAVINKPAGLTVHPCPSCPEGTLAHRLMAHFPQLALQEGLRPGIVHRLDKDTSGLLLVALTESARLRLAAAFAAREVHKEYLALVRGIPSQEGECNAPLCRHPQIKIKMAVATEQHGGRPARSTWRVLWSAPNGQCALVAVRIFTGRTHQIRVHMAHQGHPLWGDTVYGIGDVADASARRMLTSMPPCAALPARQMLHAWRIRFSHPVSQKTLEFYCPPPPDMLDAAVHLSLGHMQRLIITGNPGCGKSSLTQRLKSLGMPTFSADAIVSSLYERGAAGWDFLRQRYGARFLREDGSVNRPALLSAMRMNQDFRRELEAYLHLLVQEALKHFWQEAEATGAFCAVAEVPLYFEAGWHLDSTQPAPLTVGVDCPMPIRHARLLASRGWSAETAATLEAWQWPSSRKTAACRWRVDNSGSEEALDEQAATLALKIQELCQEEEHNLRRYLTSLWTPL